MLAGEKRWEGVREAVEAVTGGRTETSAPFLRSKDYLKNLPGEHLDRQVTFNDEKEDEELDDDDDDEEDLMKCSLNVNCEESKTGKSTTDVICINDQTPCPTTSSQTPTSTSTSNRKSRYVS